MNKEIIKAIRVIKVDYEYDIKDCVLVCHDL